MQELINCLVRHYSKKGPVVLLESQSYDHPASRYSYLAAEPEATLKAWGRKVEVIEQGNTVVFDSNPWDVLAEYRQKWDDWMFGYLGYDLKNHIEKLSSSNPDEIGAPDLFFMKPGVLFQIDHTCQTIYALKGSQPQKLSVDKVSAEVELGQLHSTVDKQQYLGMINHALNAIYEGSYYEINLSHQLQAKFKGAPLDLYRQMRSAGPVPFGAFLQFDDYSICSLSPERFICKEGNMVFSQPIKGTMKRDSQAAKDAQLKEQLLNSVKEKAENLMIVDLVRNDLSRIARQGSVEVSNLFEIQTFGTVHQMVSTIKAEAITDEPIDIIKACYPMGSMTGAPKIRAMQDIEQIEQYRRGIYSGAIGYFRPGGNFDFNVVIRSAIIKNKRLYYPVGGAITSGSNPQEEWDETWLKAKALTSAIE